MDCYYEQIKAGDQSVLGDFGTLLKQHTRTEERELFPLLETYFDNKTLEQIYQTSLDYRKAE
jgi:hemerythrin-like domain-containing protein